LLAAAVLLLLLLLLSATQQLMQRDMLNGKYASGTGPPPACWLKL
jgi:hypothetical protein